MDDSAIMCNEIIESYDEETETIPTNFNENKTTCKTQIFYRAKQKHLLGFYVTNNDLKEIMYE